jgi:hypothetical protein
MRARVRNLLSCRLHTRYTLATRPQPTLACRFQGAHAQQPIDMLCISFFLQQLDRPQLATNARLQVVAAVDWQPFCVWFIVTGPMIQPRTGSARGLGNGTGFAGTLCPATGRHQVAELRWRIPNGEREWYEDCHGLRTPGTDLPSHNLHNKCLSFSGPP